MRARRLIIDVRITSQRYTRCKDASLLESAGVTHIKYSAERFGASEPLQYDLCVHSDSIKQFYDNCPVRFQVPG